MPGVLYFSSLTFFFCYYSSSRSIFYVCLSVHQGLFYERSVFLYLIADMQQQVLVQMVCCFFLVEEMLTACHLILRMDLQSIETDGGSGLLLLASRLLQDTNMQQ
jgi:hypothetical protein